MSGFEWIATYRRGRLDPAVAYATNPVASSDYAESRIPRFSVTGLNVCLNPFYGPIPIRLRGVGQRLALIEIGVATSVRDRIPVAP